MNECECFHNGRCQGQKEAPEVRCNGDVHKCEVPEHKNKIPSDMVNHPAHYTAGGIECIDALAAATEGVCTANAIKYLWRWKLKNGVEDLKKAIWYINHLIEELGQSD